MRTLLETINFIDCSEDIDSAIIECISDSLDSDESYNVLMEAIDINPYFKNYYPLIEAISEIKTAEKEINSVKKEKDDKDKLKSINKLIDSLKKVIEWWYKIDPEKKYRTFHVVLKVCVKIAICLAIVLGPKHLKVTETIAKKLPINPNITIKSPTLKFKSGKVAVETVTRELLTKNTIAVEIVRNLLTVVNKFLISLPSEQIKWKINKDDIDNKIKSCEKMIDDLNQAISKCEDDDMQKELISDKNYTQHCMKSLILLKEKHS